MIEKNLYIKIVFSFFLSLGGFSQIVDYIFKYNPQKIYSINENKKFKNFVLKNSSSNYMVYPTYNHPLSFYGLKLVCGYQGHLWSHAIDYKGRCDDVVNIYLSKDAPSRSKLKELGVDYLVLSGFENKHSRWLNMPDFDLAFQYEDLVIYSIR